MTTNPAQTAAELQAELDAALSFLGDDKPKARKKAAPKGKRPDSVARGSNKKKTKQIAKGQRKR